MKRNLTCIVCPIGCTLEVELIDGKVVSVKGNTCPRGEKYAISECTNPERMVTTTIRCENGKVLPVKTDMHPGENKYARKVPSGRSWLQA